MGYVHVEITLAQSSKKPADPCGDVVRWERSPSATTLICSDGLGSGIKANLAATMCAARMLELLRSGFSLRDGFAMVVKTLNEARTLDLPYAVFTVARILNDGQATILSYEMPPPVLVGRRVASVLTQRSLTLDDSVIGEVNCHLEPGEGLLIVSDGITQAGLGMGLREGWTIQGVSRFVNDRLAERVAGPELPRQIHHEARTLWSKAAGDDCTAVLASCRWGRRLTVLTGPPTDRTRDAEVVHRFMRAEAPRVICGATTSQIVARHLGRKLQVEQAAESLIAPPHYALQGVDLVTEGAVTLNQMYNLLDTDPAEYEESSGVTRLCAELRQADRIDFLVGQAPNLAGGDISFRQQGILARQTIIPLIRDKLEEAGKLVVIEKI